jgi:hypothetical protein
MNDATPSAGPADLVDPAVEQASEQLDAALPEPAEESVESRAHLLPEEGAAGSDDPVRQATVILEESSARVLEDRETFEPPERRTSADTVAPLDQ